MDFVKDAKVRFLESAWTRFPGPGYALRASPNESLPGTTGRQALKMRLNRTGVIWQEYVECVIWPHRLGFFAQLARPKSTISPPWEAKAFYLTPMHYRQ